MGKVIRYVPLVVIGIILLFPVWLMVENSFTPAKAFLRMPPRLIPYEWTVKNYVEAFTLPNLPRWILNSAFIMVVAVSLGILINGAAGYVFAFAKHKWCVYVFWILMSSIFVTRYVLLISQFIIVGALGLRGIPAVILVLLFWPTGIYLFRNYYKSIPIELIESARIDGAKEWRILWSVVLPLSKPILGAAIVFLGMGVLGDYIWQMLNLQTPENKTYLVGLMASTINVLKVKNIGYDLAVGTLLFIPYLLIFAFSSKYFITGLTAGGLKE